MSKRNSEAGFTLIEVMIILAIITILAMNILSIVYADEMRAAGEHIFDTLGIHGPARFVISTFIGLIGIYIYIRPHWKEHNRIKKAQNKPIIRWKAILFMTSVPFLAIGLLIVFSRFY